MKRVRLKPDSFFVDNLSEPDTFILRLGNFGKGYMSKFGVIKPADKSEKAEKKEKKAKKPEDRNQPLRAEMDKIQNEERKAKEEAKKAHQAKKEAETKQAKQAATQAAQAAKFGDIWRYADQKKAQHNLPEDIYQKLRACEIKGEAKKILKNFLQEQERQAVSQSSVV